MFSQYDISGPIVIKIGAINRIYMRIQLVVYRNFTGNTQDQYFGNGGTGNKSVSV